jgi:hypothetical protein
MSSYRSDYFTSSRSVLDRSIAAAIELAWIVAIIAGFMMVAALIATDQLSGR